MTIICPKCGRFNENDVAWCECGYPLRPIFSKNYVFYKNSVPENVDLDEYDPKKVYLICPQCSRANKFENDICVQCGYDLLGLKMSLNLQYAYGDNRIIKESEQHKKLQEKPLSPQNLKNKSQLIFSQTQIIINNVPIKVYFANNVVKTRCPNCGILPSSPNAMYCEYCGTLIPQPIFNQLKDSFFPCFVIRRIIIPLNQLVNEGQKITIGRELILHFYKSNKAKKISRLHLSFVKIKGDFYVIDENSTNGTIHNGIRLTPGEYYLLRHNDIINIGNERNFTGYILFYKQ